MFFIGSDTLFETVSLRRSGLERLNFQFSTNASKTAVIASGSCRPSLQTIVNTTFHCLLRVGLCGCVFFIFRREGRFF